MAPTGFAAWTQSPDAVLSKWATSATDGLSSSQVAQNRRTYGVNELDKEAGKPIWKLILEQFDDTLVKILLVAAAISFALAYCEELEPGETLSITQFVEPLVILLILILNAAVGVWQENNAESALEALKDMQSDTAKVFRDGKMISDLPASELVPGDIVQLVTGDIVPADIRVIQLKTATLSTDQAALTGESVAKQKNVDVVNDEGCELQKKTCMVFSGTSVCKGSCLGVVIEIGMSTEFGKIKGQIDAAKEEEEDTPLKQKIDEFGETLSKVIGVICLVVWVINYDQFLKWESQPGSSIPDFSSVKFDFAKCTYYFKIAVALAVAAIPEGLPAVITTCLALGTRKMAKQNAIVRKLPSVETLGCTTVICSDKTGTLTTNKMSAVQLVLVNKGAKDMSAYSVEGTSFDPTGGIEQMPMADNGSFFAAAEVCALCNESRIEFGAEKGEYRCVGEPTEGALKVLAEKIGVPDKEMNAKHMQSRQAAKAGTEELACNAYASRSPKLALLEFDRTRKSMSAIVGGQGTARTAKARLVVKGAPEYVLGRCTNVMMPDGSTVKLTAALRKTIEAQISSMANQALRCIGLASKASADMGSLASYNGPAHKAHKELENVDNYVEIESGLTFIGIAGLRDPPRPEVRASIEECRVAGVRIIMITGDNPETAEAVGREIGILQASDAAEGKCLTGRAFADLSKKDQLAMLSGAGGRIFSRAEPEHKIAIVRLLKEAGEVVAMTGDGVNDAPALQSAHIGIAMGITGTEVAKQVSDLVLADDNFSTIVSAVSEGRSIYSNMKAFIRYMISSNIGEVVSIFITAVLGLPEGLIPVQLLWVNLVTDGPPATALGFNPPDLDIMKKPPRKASDPLINSWVFFRYMVVGLYVGFATVAVFAVWYMYDNFMGIDLSQDGHSTVTYHQLTHWGDCAEWTGFAPAAWTAGEQTFSFVGNPCDYFAEGKAKASTLSLTVLVAIEMFNALNALSEDGSLLSMPPWVNPALLAAMVVSFGLHFVILYVPWLAKIFAIVPLNWNEWMLVLLFSSPVLLLDEVLKFFGRIRQAAELKARGY